jgi:hypothetical protein
MTPTTSTTTAPEAIFIPIDLEASLGRIEEMNSEKNEANIMDCADQQQQQQSPPPPPQHNTRTSSRTPFTSSLRDDPIAPYPISETDAEIKERQRLSESVGNHWSLVSPQSSGNDDDSMMEVTATDSPLDDDDFSLTEDGAGSLVGQEDLQLERIDDPISFWEDNIPTEEYCFKQLHGMVMTFIRRKGSKSHHINNHLDAREETLLLNAHHSYRDCCTLKMGGLSRPSRRL